MSSLLLTNCQIVSSAGITEGNILIENGRIKKILSTNEWPSADQTIDLKGLHTLPGLIDAHVHFREPGASHKEDWGTGSRAAAAGGVTTVIDMPNTTPPTTTLERLNEKRHIATEKSIVNFGFFFGVDSSNIEELNKATNIAGIKIYLNETTGNYLVNDPDVLQKIFSRKARFALHAESETFRNIMDMVSPTGNPVHLCHANSADHIAVAQHYKERNYPLTVEVSPHHLFLTAVDVATLKNFALVKPPLGTQHDQETLWHALADGTIDTIASDHAPHTRQEKQSATPPFGMPGLETMLPLMLDAVNKKRLMLQRLVELGAENPAVIFKIPHKGFLKEGYDADITVIDMKLARGVKNELLFTKCGWSPFTGWKLKGFPVMTFVNGTLVYNLGVIVNESERGREVTFE